MAPVRVLHRTVALAIAAATLAAAPAPSPAAPPETPAWIDELNRLAPYLGRSVSTDELRAIEAALSSGRPEVRALSAALLYRADPVRWGPELSSSFTIRDHAPRARGEAKEIAQDDFISRIKALESRYPSLPPPLALAVAFIELRDANLWFAQGGQQVSVARFLRGALLAHAFKGSDLDAVSVAGQLDQAARQESGRGSKAKE